MASDLGLHCLQRPVCPNIKDYYGICNSFSHSSKYVAYPVNIFLISP